jgi:hypothetical protein
LPYVVQVAREKPLAGPVRGYLRPANFEDLSRTYFPQSLPSSLLHNMAERVRQIASQFMASSGKAALERKSPDDGEFGRILTCSEGGATRLGSFEADSVVGGRYLKVVVTMAIRTPLCKSRKGGFKDTRSDELLTETFRVRRRG